MVYASHYRRNRNLPLCTQPTADCQKSFRQSHQLHLAGIRNSRIFDISTRYVFLETSHPIHYSSTDGYGLTGLVINYKTVTICGTLGALSSIGCLFYEGFNQVLIFAPVFIFMMIIPGHVLNHAARKQKKL